MERRVKIAAVQMKSVMKDVKGNLDKAIDFIEKAVKNEANIICLPELFYSGYHLEKEEFYSVAEKVDGFMFRTLAKVAKDNKVHIIAPYPEITDIPGVLYNSALMIDDYGNLAGNMRKVYLWEKEKLSFRAGSQFPIMNTSIGKIGILICADAEWFEPSRILALKGAELIFVPSVWSMGAKPRWDIDLTAGALYNLLFMAGVNTIEDGACGSSKIVNPKGEVLVQASIEREEIIYSDIDLQDVLQARIKIPYMRDFKPETFSMEATIRL